jgi:hypothetical protein
MLTMPILLLCRKNLVLTFWYVGVCWCWWPSYLRYRNVEREYHCGSHGGGYHGSSGYANSSAEPVADSGHHRRSYAEHLSNHGDEIYNYGYAVPKNLTTGGGGSDRGGNGSSWARKGRAVDDDEGSGSGGGHSDEEEACDDYVTPLMFGLVLDGHGITFNFIVIEVLMCFHFGIATQELTESFLPGGIM